MIRKLKTILYSIGGVAALAGAYLYFKRKKELQSTYEYQLMKLRKEFFNSDKMKLSTYQINFDQLFMRATLDINQQERSIFERLKFSSEKLENHDSCSVHLKSGATYYECWDCSTIRQNIATYNKKKSEENCIYLTVCEDCFDISKHKGHTYTRHQAANEEVFRCSCGDKEFMKKETFCSKHFGFDGLIDIFRDQEKLDPTMWKQLENFFLDVFHIAIDSASISLYVTLNGQGEKAKQIKDHFNAFLTFIFLKINEIIELNHSSLIFFTELFSQSLRRPLQIKMQRLLYDNKDWRYKLQIMGKREVNKDLSILEYLLIFSKLINQSNDKTIATLFRKLIQVSDRFRQFFSEKFFRFIFFTFKPEKKEIPETNTVQVRGTLSSIAHMMIEQVSLMSVFNHLVDSLGEEIFNPLDLLIEYIQTKPPQVTGNDEVIYLLYNICFEMFKQFDMLKVIIVKFHREIIQKLFDLSYKLFIKNSIQFKKEMTSGQQQNYFLSNLEQVLQSLHMQQIEQQTLLCFTNFYEGIMLINDENLNKQVITFLCDIYSRYAVIACLFLTKMSEEGLSFISLSISFITQLPLLIALKQKKVFNQENVNEFFDNSFTYDIKSTDESNQEEIEKKKKQNKLILLSSIKLILNSFLLVNTQTSFYQEMKLTLRKVNPNSPDGQQLSQIIQYVLDFAITPNMRIYDFFTLTYQLVSLAEDTQELHSISNIYNKQLLFFSKAKQQNVYVFISAEITYTVAQMLLDSSPFINVFANNFEGFFPELKNEEHLNKKLYIKNMNQTIATIIQARSKNKMFVKDIEHFCRTSLYQPHQLQQYISNVCNPHINNQIVDNENITLKSEYQMKVYPKNYLRIYDEVYRVIQSLQSSNEESLQLFPFIGSDTDLESLFSYQVELIEKILTKLVCEDSQFHHVSYFFSLQLYLTLNFLLKNRGNTDLGEEKQTEISKILQIYQESEFNEKINKQIEEELSLSKKRITDGSEKQMLRKLKEMLEQLNQK